MERATGGTLAGPEPSRDHRERAVHVRARARGEQPDRVRMPWPVEDLEHRPFLDDAAEVHDEHAVAELGDDAEVVRDQDQRQAVLLPAAARAAG